MGRPDRQSLVLCPYGLPTLSSFAMRSWPSSLVSGLSMALPRGL